MKARFFRKSLKHALFTASSWVLTAWILHILFDFSYTTLFLIFVVTDHITSMAVVRTIREIAKEENEKIITTSMRHINLDAIQELLDRAKKHSL